MNQRPYENTDVICENISYNESGNLTFAGHDLSELAKEYGTPTYFIDEERVRNRCRTYMDAVKKAFGDKGRVFYASKASSFKRIYEILKEEGLGVDVVSSGEIYTASLAKFPMENSMFHSNNKTDLDISYGIDSGVGYFVVDNVEELDAIDKIAEQKGKIQPVILRLTPGIDTHTYEAVNTGKVDSKFGSAIETGQAKNITEVALKCKNIRLCGFHCHIGSQVFDSKVYISAAEKMLDFVALVNASLGFKCEILDIGGGYGVRYVASQPEIDIASNIAEVGRFITEKCDSLQIDMPIICFEPGRSIIADAGLTLYTVGTVKRIPNYKNYVSVDGGMPDNIRFALYNAPYTVIPVVNTDAVRDMQCSVVGRCCESGDIIQENVYLPSDIHRGDLIACLTTGAYHYSMASNYNKIPRPPIVMLTKDGSYYAVKRETIERLAELDI